MNYRLIAIQVSDLLKYDTTVNSIQRAAKSVFSFNKEEFPQEPSITSVRAKLIYDWILSLANQKMDEQKRNDNLISFLRLLTPADKISIIQKILFEGGVKIIFAEESREFFERRFHYLISRYCFDLFSNGHYFHAVFEAVKIYNNVVKEKSNNTKDGVSLMMEVWSPEGVLKVTKCETETEKNFQNGLKFLSAGLMQAIRNPVAHEPEFEWPISKEDCLDLLSFISYLLRQVDRAVYYK